jgi:hypothetical protein
MHKPSNRPRGLWFVLRQRTEIGEKKKREKRRRGPGGRCGVKFVGNLDRVQVLPLAKRAGVR